MAGCFLFSVVLFVLALALGVWLGVNNPDMFDFMNTSGLPSPSPVPKPGEGGGGLPPVTMPGEGGSGLPPPESSTTETTVPKPATGAQGSSGNHMAAGEKALALPLASA